MTLLLGFGAVNTGNNLLYLLVSACLGFMAISGIMGRLNLAGLEASLEPPDELYDGIETLMSVRLASRRRGLPAFLLQVRLEDRQLLFPFVPPRGQTLRSCTLSLAGRGERPLPEMELRSIFPINFFVRRLSFAPPGTLTVFPAPRPCPGATDAAPASKNGSLSSAARGYEGDLQGIADYSGNEPQRLIHWKLSARHDELKIKELESSGEAPVIIDPPTLPGADLEEQLGAAVWLVNRCLHRNRPVGLKVAERLIPAATGRGHRLALLRELALYDRH